MGSKLNTPRPIEGLQFADVHCHLPWTEGRRDPTLPTPEKQLQNFRAIGGQFLITSSIDMKSASIMLEFCKKHDGVYLACGMAPQTVTYTEETKYQADFKKWKSFVEKNLDDISCFGEIGLDFHHAKTIEKRIKQINELKNIFSFLAGKEKPIMLHVRNAGPGDMDHQNPNHSYNDDDGATRNILKILNQYNISPKSVMFHCYSGPISMNQELSKMGFTFSIPSSSFGFNKWNKIANNLPLDQVVTETDSPFQHPELMKPVNVPSNARFAIATLAHLNKKNQEEVAEIVLKNARAFFNL
jgi:TatD DNase family protein